MEYYSTKDTVKRMSASEAISRGLAPDGGLYVPATLPQVSERELMELQPLGYGERAKRILAMYLPEYSPPPPWRPCALQKRPPHTWSFGTGRQRPSRTWRSKCCPIC